MRSHPPSCTKLLRYPPTDMSSLEQLQRSEPNHQEGEANGCFYPMLDLNGEKYHTFGVYTYGWVQVPFQAMQSRKPFGSEARRWSCFAT